MGRKYAIFICLATAVIATLAAVRIRTWHLPSQSDLLIGAVFRDDEDPAKRSPLSDVIVTGSAGSVAETTKSDSSGFFRLTIHKGLLSGQPITLRFKHAEYQPLEISATDTKLLYAVRMKSLIRESVVKRTEAAVKPVQIRNVRVRYSVKNQTTINVGSLVRQFQVVNQGNVPCRNHPPCSPDGKWKAATASLPLDAQDDNEFRNVRVSCIAGPCPFTRLQPNDLSRPARRIEVKALDWSDTASFLVEAEVTRTMTSDMVLQSYPFLTGQTMSFALPPAAEGPSIVADVNGSEVVFPLGPTLALSWSTCSVQAEPGGNRIFRCELKPGYQFQQ